jgi:hypothetical protein
MFGHVVESEEIITVEAELEKTEEQDTIPVTHRV